MYLHTQFGIDEVYLQENFDFNLLKKLQQRAELTLDSTDNIVRKHLAHDLILIFHKRIPSRGFIYRFLESLYGHPQKEEFIEDHTLLNESELFEAIKSKTFVLVTHRDLSTD